MKSRRNSFDIDINFESEYVPMLHAQSIDFEEDNIDAIVTTGASSCFIMALLSVCDSKDSDIEIDSDVEIDKALLSHFNVDQLNSPRSLSCLLDVLYDFQEDCVEESKTVAVICGGGLRDDYNEQVLLDALSLANVDTVHNFRSVYSFNEETMFDLDNIDLTSDNITLDDCKNDGFMNTISAGITKNKLFLFSEKKHFIEDDQVDSLDQTGRLSEISFDSDNLTPRLRNGNPTIDAPERVNSVSADTFQIMFNGRDRFRQQFFEGEEEASRFFDSGDSSVDNTIQYTRGCKW